MTDKSIGLSPLVFELHSSSRKRWQGVNFRIKASLYDKSGAAMVDIQGGPCEAESNQLKVVPQRRGPQARDSVGKIVETASEQLGADNYAEDVAPHRNSQTGNLVEDEEPSLDALNTLMRGLMSTSPEDSASARSAAKIVLKEDDDIGLDFQGFAPQQKQDAHRTFLRAVRAVAAALGESHV